MATWSRPLPISRSRPVRTSAVRLRRRLASAAPARLAGRTAALGASGDSGSWRPERLAVWLRTVGRLPPGRVDDAPPRDHHPQLRDRQYPPVSYANFVKKLQLAPGFNPPARLTYDDLVATAISRENLSDDVRGINANIELILRTRGGGWPTEPVTEEFNFVDLVWHECEFREGYSFTYAVHDAGGAYLGCCYRYPVGRRTELTEKLLDHDVDVSWWVTPDAYERGYYTKLYTALQY